MTTIRQAALLILGITLLPITLTVLALGVSGVWVYELFEQRRY